METDNEIIEFKQIDFFDEELSDNGISEEKIWFRIMNDCFYG